MRHIIYIAVKILYCKCYYLPVADIFCIRIKSEPPKLSGTFNTDPACWYPLGIEMFRQQNSTIELQLHKLTKFGRCCDKFGAPSWVVACACPDAAAANALSAIAILWLKGKTSSTYFGLWFKFNNFFRTVYGTLYRITIFVW